MHLTTGHPVTARSAAPADMASRSRRAAGCCRCLC